LELKMANTDKVCFDRILPQDLSAPIPGRMMSIGIGTARAAFQISKLWPNGSILKIRFINGTSAQQEIVKRFAPQWCNYANLTFEFGNAVDAQIRIAFNDDGAWSSVGTDASRVSRNQPTMNFGWQDEAVVLHEFGHAIGLIHEHQNPLTNPIKWNKSVVDVALSGSPNFFTPEEIETNMYEKYAVSQINGSDFDLNSIMLYSFPANWTLNGIATPVNEKLSEVDKAFATNVYPGRPNNQSVVIPIGAAGITGNIGQPAEEDLYKFTADRSGTYTIETNGTTDLVMSLYGGISSTNLIAQDDDSGVGYNPQIVANLNPGEYTLQVRHYNNIGGTGSYVIKVIQS
jgi:hypothetical protein